MRKGREVTVSQLRLYHSYRYGDATREAWQGEKSKLEKNKALKYDLYWTP